MVGTGGVTGDGARLIIRLQFGRGQATRCDELLQISRQLQGHLTYFFPGGAFLMGCKLNVWGKIKSIYDPSETDQISSPLLHCTGCISQRAGRASLKLIENIEDCETVFVSECLHEMSIIAEQTRQVTIGSPRSSFDV
jgi:hypothetical protein